MKTDASVATQKEEEQSGTDSDREEVECDGPLEIAYVAEIAKEAVRAMSLTSVA